MDKRTKYILIGLGVVGFGVGGYYIYEHFKGGKKGDNKSEELEKIIRESNSTSNDTPFQTTSTTSSSGKYLPSGFPLQKGSKGDLVTNLQKALIKKYGKSVLPKYGADGDFGSETANALTSKGLPTIIDSDSYTSILLKTGSSNKNISVSGTERIKFIATKLFASIEADKFWTAIAYLKNIKNVADYTDINTEFKKKRINGGVRRTLVSALLYFFNSSSEKKTINQQLYRIGLKNDGSKWSLKGLSGFSPDNLVTIEKTKIWDEHGTAMMIPTGTIIGEYLDSANGVTQIETLDGKRLFIKTTVIRYLS